MMSAQCIHNILFINKCYFQELAQVKLFRRHVNMWTYMKMFHRHSLSFSSCHGAAAVRRLVPVILISVRSLGLGHALVVRGLGIDHGRCLHVAPPHGLRGHVLGVN